MSTNGWPTTPLSECGTWLSGGTPATDNAAYWNGDIPWISAASLKDFYIADSERRVTKTGAGNGTRLVPKDTVLMVVRGMSLKKEFRVGVAQREVAFGQDCKAIVPAPKFDGRFLARYLRFMEPQVMALVDNASHGTGRLRTEALAAIDVPTPEPQEQRRIADILDKADAVRRKRAEAIGLVDDLTKAVFLEMFGDPVTNPKGWPVVTLGSQLEELRYGTSEKCSESRRPGEIGVLRIPNVVGELINLDDVKFAALDEAEVDRLKLVNDDLLFVRSNGNPEYIARCAVVDEPAVGYAFASYLIRARFKRDSTLRAPFVRDVVSFPTYRRHLVQQARTTAGNYNINTQGLSSLRLIVPPLTLQDEYVASHKALAGLHRKEVAGQGEAEILFDSLVHRAFNGEL